jgi:hypothetical protein
MNIACKTIEIDKLPTSVPSPFNGVAGGKDFGNDVEVFIEFVDGLSILPSKSGDKVKGF